MGASGWSYVTPYSEDPTVWLGRLHREVLASGDYYWGDDEVPRPSTMEQLSALFEQDEDLACEGTHTILDIWQVAPPGVRPAGNDIFGTLISLNEDEVRLMFGTDRPMRSSSARWTRPTVGPTRCRRCVGRGTTRHCSGRGYPLPTRSGASPATEPGSPRSRGPGRRP
jgi:hypothetical protein